MHKKGFEGAKWVKGEVVRKKFKIFRIALSKYDGLRTGFK